MSATFGDILKGVRKGHEATLTPAGRSRAAIFVWSGPTATGKEAEQQAVACLEIAWSAMTAAIGAPGLAMPADWTDLKVQTVPNGARRESWAVGRRMILALPEAAIGTMTPYEAERWPSRIIASQRSLRHLLGHGEKTTLTAKPCGYQATNRDAFWADLRHPNEAARLTRASERALLAACAAKLAIEGHRKLTSLESASMVLPASATLCAAERRRAGAHAPRLMAPIIATLRGWGIAGLADDLQAQAEADALSASGVAPEANP